MPAVGILYARHPRRGTLVADTVTLAIQVAASTAVRLFVDRQQTVEEYMGNDGTIYSRAKTGIMDDDNYKRGRWQYSMKISMSASGTNPPLP